MEQKGLHEKFSSTAQERIRLSCALEGFFEENISKSVKADYGNYLKRRIRPAMENLLLEENIPKMEILEQQGWFGRKELDSFIQIAREQERLESLVWLMLLKDQKYGYDEPDFTL